MHRLHIANAVVGAPGSRRHGRQARRGEAFENGVKANALVSDDHEMLLAVRVADCVPVLLASESGNIVAAIHAGWRGVIAGVVTNALRALQVDPREVIAAIGAGIGFDAFEVGLEVIEQFEIKFRKRCPHPPHARWQGARQLRRAILHQLIRAGMDETKIDTTDRCTFRDRDEFFSHRRDNGITGRMAAMIIAAGR